MGRKGKKEKKEKKARKIEEKLPALGWRGWIWRLGLSGVGGVAVFLAFPAFDLWPLAWVAMVPTLFAVEGLSPKRHFLLGLWAGFITNLGGFYWMTGMLMDFGHLPWAISFALNALLAVYQGLVFALWLWLLARLRAKSKLGTWLLAPMTYVAAEFAIWFLFPWFYANSQYLAIPMIQICELGGVMLLSFLLVAANGALFDGLRALMAKRRKQAIILLAVWLLVPLVNAGYGLLRMYMVDGQVAEATKLRVGMVEADVGIWEKEDRRKVDDNLVRNQRLSVDLAQQGAELIVWPETAYPSRGVYARVPGQSEFRRYGIMPRNVVAVAQSSVAPPDHASEDRRLRVRREDIKVPQRGFTTPLLFGALTYRENPESKSVRHKGLDFLNTAILIDEKGKVLGAYDKVYRLMFGEYVPFSEYFPQVYQWVPEAGDLSKGTEIKSLPFRNFKLGIMVCYEDILPAFGRELAQTGPNVFVNMTNDAWFGKTAEPYLHLALAVFRTVEHRLAMVRSTNTGVSAFIDPMGRISQQTKLTDAEAIIETVPIMPGGTVYAWIGDWPAWLSILGMLWLWIRPLLLRRRSC